MGKPWVLPAAVWGCQDPWGQYMFRAASCFTGAMQLQGGMGMPSLPSSASSARAPERFISSKWIPTINQFKSQYLKSSQVPSHGVVAVT